MNSAASIVVVDSKIRQVLQQGSSAGDRRRPCEGWARCDVPEDGMTRVGPAAPTSPRRFSGRGPEFG
jgi:hypothetical protein